MTLRRIGIGLLTLCAGCFPGCLYGQWASCPTGICYTGGNVGIGTASPVNPLHIHVGADQNLLVGTYQGAAYLQTVNDAANATTPMQFLGSQFTFRAFNGTGNVGIGTAAPAAKLHVVLPAARASTFDAGNSTTWADTIMSNPVGTVGPATGIGFDVDPVALQGNQTVLSGIAAVRTNANAADGGSDLVFISRPVGYVSAERMRITSAGNVGIGTTSPSYKLDVLGSIRANGGQIYVANSSATASRIMLFGGTDGGTSGVYLVNGNANYNTYLGDGTYNSYINAQGGNVGIGTTNPTSKLSVNGTIQAKEVIVNTGWADYVFSPSYRLAPLSEVAAYIQQNHHLPEMPSASEVQEKGVNLGDMQAKLLAKVEELTLHTIRLEEDNRKLKERVAQIEAFGTKEPR